MNEFEARYDQIQHYLKGRLSEEESLLFEKEMAANKWLKEEVQIQKAAFDLMERAYMAQMSTLVREQVSKGSNSRWKKWAGLGLILVVAYSVWVSFNEEVGSLPNGLKGEPVKVTTENSNVDSLEDREIVSEVKEGNYEVNGSSDQGVEVEGLEPGRVSKVKVDTAMVSKVFVEREEVEDVELEMRAEQSQTTNKESVSEDYRLEDDCLVLPNYSIQVSKAHLNSDDGMLSIDSKSKLEVSINGEDFVESTRFEDLQADVYDVLLRDQNGCQFNVGAVVVERSSCGAQKNISFNVEFEESVSLPLNENYSSNIQIFNKLGLLQWEVNKDGEIAVEWGGENSQGQEVTIGNYKAIIKYESGEACIYNVVIEK